MKYLRLLIFIQLSSSGFVHKQCVEDYIGNRDKYIKKGRGHDFKNAVSKIEEFIIDPLVRY